MARTSDTVRSDEDEPFSLGRPLIVGTIAGVIACYGFVSGLGYNNYSNSFWRDAPRVATVSQPASSANQPGPGEAQAPASEQPTDQYAPPTQDQTQDQQRAPQSQDPMQNPPDDQNDGQPAP